MKVSIVHPERRCAQHLALDVVTPEQHAHKLPEKLLPTQRFDLALGAGALLAIVVSAHFKDRGPAPLLLELEAEEGEALTESTVRAFGFDSTTTEYYTVKALDELDVDEKLVRLPAPLTLAGDHQQFGLVIVEISPAHDVLIAIAAPGAPA